MVENIDSADHVIQEIESHIEMLKGEYLQGIVGEIRDIKSKIQICKKSKMCQLSADVSKNYIYEICRCIMKMFTTMMKQL